jgi:hypothetical protein
MLVSNLSSTHHHYVIAKQSAGEKNSSYVDSVECEIKLVDGGVEEKNGHREKKLEERVPIKCLPRTPNKAAVEISCIGGSYEKQNEEHKKVAMIVVPNAASCEQTVVVSLQHTNSTVFAVPGPWRYIGLAY